MTTKCLPPGGAHGNASPHCLAAGRVEAPALQDAEAGNKAQGVVEAHKLQQKHWLGRLARQGLVGWWEGFCHYGVGKKPISLQKLGLMKS